METDKRFELDRKINLSTVLAAALVLITVILAYADTNHNISTVEDKVTLIEEEE